MRKNFNSFAVPGKVSLLEKEAKEFLLAALQEAELSLSQLNALYQDKQPANQQQEPLKPKVTDTKLAFNFDDLDPIEKDDLDIRRTDNNDFVIGTNKPIKLLVVNKQEEPKQLPAVENLAIKLMSDAPVVIKPLEDEVLAPMEADPEYASTLDHSTEDPHSDLLSNEVDSAGYDIFGSLPELDLTNDVAQHSQGMMPRVHMAPSAVVLRDKPLGLVKPVAGNIKSIEDDPDGLSVVGMDGGLAMKLF